MYVALSDNESYNKIQNLKNNFNENINKILVYQEDLK